jgi:hypothetical protein
MKLHPTFSVGNRTTSANTQPKPTKQSPRPVVEEEDFFSSMEPQYKPPTKVAVKRPTTSQNRQKKKSNLGFEVSELEVSWISSFSFHHLS